MEVRAGGLKWHKDSAVRVGRTRGIPIRFKNFSDKVLSTGGEHKLRIALDYNIETRENRKQLTHWGRGF